MAIGFLIKFIGTLMDLFLPWTLAYMIDTVIPANQRPEIFLWGFFMIFCSILAVVFSGCVELLQEYCTTYRGGDWMDFAANTTGAVLASLIGYFIVRPRMLSKK